MKNNTWIICPVCGGKTRNQIREDTVLINYPLFCPKCKHTTLIDVKNLKITFVKEALIKSGVHDAQSDFSSDCIKTTQAYCRMSRNFCAGWRKICKQNVRQVEDVI